MADESVFQGDLMNGERVYWTGQPDPSVIFASSDIFAIPFSLMWAGFAFFWEATVLGINPFLPAFHQHPAPFFFRLWGIPFVIMGIYMTVGRFFYQSWQKRRTAYAVTNQRLLIKTGGNLQALFLTNLPAVNKSVNSRGLGTLSFGDNSYGSFYTNTGMGFMGRRYGSNRFAFYDVPDAESVYHMINELKAKASEPKT